MTMLNTEMPISEVLNVFEYGEYNAFDLWYDWFCKTSSLSNKSKTLLPKLKAIVKANAGKKFLSTETYVFFKNNYPLYGRLYDDFRICDKETGDVLYTIVPKSGHRSEMGMSVLYGKDNNFQEPLVLGTWKDVVNYFKA